MFNLRIAASMAACSALVFAGVAGSVSASNDSTMTPENLLPMFQSAASTDDAFPAEVKPEELGIAAQAESRSLGSDSVARYWVTLAERSQVCLVMYIPGGYEVAGSTCGTLTDFNQKGLKLKLRSNIDGNIVSRVAYLFPSDVELTSLTADSRGTESENFVALTPEQNADFTPRDLARSGHSDFVFYPIGE